MRFIQTEIPSPRDAGVERQNREKEEYRMPEIELGNHIKKDLYQETMNLINGNVDEKQFIKDNVYYDMVKAIYENGFARIAKNASIHDYVHEAVSIYKKLDDLNHYFGLNFRPDMILLMYVAGQFVRYFKDRPVMQQETEKSFAGRLHAALPLSQATPFERMNILQGQHIGLNDKLYKTKTSNEDIVKATGLNRNFIMELRSGRRSLTKDIVYMLALAMRLSWIEFCQLMETLDIDWGEEKERDKLLKEILENLIQLINLDVNEKKNSVQVANNYLAERGAALLEVKVSKAKERENVCTILITGGLGFIGRHCIDYFRRLNEQAGTVKYRICVLSRTRPKTENIPEGIICYSGQSDNKYVYERILIENNVDYILHLASVSSVGISEQEPAETFTSSYSITVICDAILENHIWIKGLIFPSSQLVYEGKMDASEQWKETDPINPFGLNNYVKAKLIAEGELESFSKKGIPVAIARLANVYGPNDESTDRLIPKTIQLLRKGKAPQIYINKKTGKSAMKNFIYVEDLIKAFHAIMDLSENKIYAPNAFENTYNIGAPKAVSVEDIVKLLIKLTGAKIEPIYIETDRIFKDDKLCVDKARKRLHFTAETTLEEGLKKILDSMDEKGKKK